MYLDKMKLMEYMNEHFDGNYRKFARALNVEVAQLHRILNSEAQAGTVFLGRLHLFCTKNNVDFNEFIFFDHTINYS